MIFHKKPAESAGADPVRLMGFGATGMRLVESLQQQAIGPLADLLAEHPEWIGPADISAAVGSIDFTGVAFLFVAIGDDATKSDVRHAVVLARRASEYATATLAVVVRTSGRRPKANPLAIHERPGRPAPMLNQLLDLIDGLIEIQVSSYADDVEALGWLYGTLRSLAREGVLILEPAWDLDDVVEVLDLPRAQLKLLTRIALPNGCVLDAVAEGIEDSQQADTDLSLASGMLVIVWQAPPRRLTVQQVREISRMVHSAMGSGSQHMVLTARIPSVQNKTYAIGGCATLVVSSGRSSIAPGDWP